MPRKDKSLVDRAVDSAGGVVDAALPVIGNAAAQVREQAAPLIAETKVLAGEIAEATREVAIPKAKTAAVTGAASAAALAAAGRDLANAKVAEAKGEKPKRKGSKFRKLLFFGMLAAAAGFVYNKMRPTPEADNWQSSYTPPERTSAGSTSSTTSATTGPTTGSTIGSAAAGTGGAHLAPGVGSDEPLATDDPMAKLSAESAAGDDPGGASPDEAIADAAEQPHDVTTPDDPADVVDLEGKATRKK